MFVENRVNPASILGQRDTSLSDSVDHYNDGTISLGPILSASGTQKNLGEIEFRSSPNLG